MQVSALFSISIALSAATLLLFGCACDSGSSTDRTDAGPGDGGPDMLNDSKADGAGGSDNPDPQCTDTETECGTACCDNETDVCNGVVCELKAEICEIGTTCEKGKVCDSEGECRDGCFINKKLYEHGDKNPSNPCESCEADSTTSWTPSAADGTACGGDKFCNASGKCVAGCIIGGHVYDIGERSPSGKCEVCSVPNSTAWSQAASGDLCSDGGTVCRFDGKCVEALSVAAGFGHTCGVTPVGRAMCWGHNWMGELGTGGVASPIPVGVLGLESGVVGIAAGWEYSCALKATGQVMCWGENNYGQIGVGTSTTHYKTPQPVVGIPSEAVSIVVGDRHTCAGFADGAAMCWGSNSWGQLGNPSPHASSPIQVVGLPSAVASMSAGSGHTCAILVDSSLWCWGYNENGQLGDGSNTHRTEPVRPGNLADNIVRVASGGTHTCALDSNGVVTCWGANNHGQCGRWGGDKLVEPGPPVEGLSLDVVGLSTGGMFSCAWTATGAAMCWGRNDMGQLGDKYAAPERYSAGFVSGLSSGVRGLSTILFEHACAIMGSGKVRCWGYNSGGQIGDGSQGSPHSTPTALTLFP